MIVTLLASARIDLRSAFDYYHAIRPDLGQDLMDEYSRGIQEILSNPSAWQKLDGTFRRYRLRRFPYGIIYHEEKQRQEIIVVSVMHLSRRPDLWRSRLK
jgi:plasmid stabilization system protein ParE